MGAGAGPPGHWAGWRLKEDGNQYPEAMGRGLGGRDVHSRTGQAIGGH